MGPVLFGGGAQYILPEQANLTFYRSPKNFVGTDQKNVFGTYQKYFSGHTNKNFPDIPKNLPVNIRKICRT